MAKLKTCKACKQKFELVRPLQHVCSCKCSIALVEANKQKESLKEARKQRQERKEALNAIRPLKWYEDRLQTAINAYVVHVRDKDEGCISCGTKNPNIQYCAGHFRTRGAASQHRYNLDNLNKQCNQYCNLRLSGNIIKYQPALIAKIGQERFDALMNDNTSRRYTVEWLEEMTAYYRKKTKELKNA